MKTLLVDARKVLVVQEWIYQPLYDLLETYPNPKIIVSNANPQEQENLWLTNLPYPLFSLHHQPEKTDPEYYKTLLRDFNLTPENVVYFESGEEAVESARSVGIKTYYFDWQVKDIESLKKFLDEHLE